MKTILRVVATLSVLASIGLAGAGGVAAAGADSLGATIQSRVYVDEDRSLQVWNRSTVPVTFTFSSGGDWSTDPTALTLEPDAKGTVNVVGDGEDGAGFDILVSRATATPAGEEATALKFNVTIFHARPFDASKLIAPVLYGIFGLVVVALILRRLRPWEWRVTRATQRPEA